jgi:hypothetical protein
MAEREEIEEQFQANVERVRGLVTLYEEIVPEGPGRKPVPVADLLRAAVVLLHATLEDLLRSLAEWKLPGASAASLGGIWFADARKSKEKFDLGDLADFRGQTIDSVITRSVKAHLDRSSYNHPGEIAEILDRIGVSYTIPTSQRNALAAMMSRRHQIAHRADRNPLSGSGHQRAVSISASIVNRWIGVVEAVGTEILA